MRIETGKAENTVVGIFGYKGSFKTTLATYLVHEDSLTMYDRTVYCNYKLSFKFDWLKADELILDVDKFNNTIICIDELHEYADSRNSSSFQNRLISSFFLQSRHTNSNVYYTSQYEDQIDKRIIRITDIFIYCQNLYTDIDKDGDNDLCQFDIIDLRYNSSCSKILYAKPIFGMFNTRERINPFFMSKEKEKEFKDKMNYINENR